MPTLDRPRRAADRKAPRSEVVFVEYEGDRQRGDGYYLKAINGLRSLYRQAKGGSMAGTIQENDAEIRLKVKGNLGRIKIIVPDLGGIMVKPVSKEHPKGWGNPLATENGEPINPPLGTAQAIEGKNNIELKPKKEKRTDPLQPLKVRQRGVKDKAGNILTATRIGLAGDKYDIVTFNGPPANWTYDAPPFKGFIGGNQIPWPEDWADYWLWFNGRKVETPIWVLAAKAVEKLVEDKKEKRIYIFGYDGIRNYSVQYTVNKKDWIVVGEIRNCMDEIHISNGKYVDGYTPSEPGNIGDLCFFSRPEFNNDCTELSFILCAFQILDGSAHLAGAFGDTFLQKYIATLSINVDSINYSIIRYDADNGSFSNHSLIPEADSDEWLSMTWHFIWKHPNTEERIDQVVNNYSTNHYYGGYTSHSESHNKDLMYICYDENSVRTPVYIVVDALSGGSMTPHMIVNESRSELIGPNPPGWGTTIGTGWVVMTGESYGVPGTNPTDPATTGVVTNGPFDFNKVLDGTFVMRDWPALSSPMPWEKKILYYDHKNKVIFHQQGPDEQEPPQYVLRINGNDKKTMPSVPVSHPRSQFFNFHDINNAKLGCLFDPRWGHQFFSCLVGPSDDRVYLAGFPAPSVEILEQCRFAFNWSSGEELTALTGTDVGAPTDTKVYFPLINAL